MNMTLGTVSADNPNDVLALLPPYPIVLATTRTNIITIGQIMHFTFSPLRIGIAIAHERHTWSLLKEEREFVINVPEVKLVDAVQICGAISGRDHDKFAEAGLTAVKSAKVGAMSIAECAAHIECAVEREFEFEERTWFVGRVLIARTRDGHRGSHALLCGRTHYSLVGENVAPR